jgi:hypothetical protein
MRKSNGPFVRKITGQGIECRDHIWSVTPSSGQFMLFAVKHRPNNTIEGLLYWILNSQRRRWGRLMMSFRVCDVIQRLKSYDMHLYIERMPNCENPTTAIEGVKKKQWHIKTDQYNRNSGSGFPVGYIRHIRAANNFQTAWDTQVSRVSRDRTKSNSNIRLVTSFSIRCTPPRPPSFSHEPTHIVSVGPILTVPRGDVRPVEQ